MESARTSLANSAYQKYKLETLVAPVVPFLILGIAVATAITAVVHVLVMGNAESTIAITLFLSMMISLVLVWVTRIATRQQNTTLSGIAGVLFMGNVSTTATLVSHFTKEGIFQALPYCLIAALGGSVFWINWRHFMLGQIACLASPFLLLLATDTSQSAWIYAIQLAGYGTIVCIILYLLLRSYGLRTFQMTSELHERATIDGLTGALNRSTWIARATNLLSEPEYQEGHGTATVLFIDLDNFKHVNDRHGHEAGDRVLQMVATALARSVAPPHLIGRFGGDEFVVFLAQTNWSQAAVIEQAIHKAIVDREVDIQAEMIRVCIGKASWRQGELLTHLLQRADIAMLEAKEG